MIKNNILAIAKKILDCCCFLLLVPSYIRCPKVIEKNKIKRILCINLQGIGDILMTTPFIISLKKEFPEAKIDYLCYKENGIFLKNIVNNILKRQENNIVSAEFLKICHLINSNNYDLVINLFHAQHSALLTVMSNARYKLGPLYNLKVSSNNLAIKKRDDRKATWDVRELCRTIAANLEIELHNPYKLNIQINEDIERDIKKLLKKILKEKKYKEYIILNPSAQWVSKKWPDEYWQWLIQKIRKDKRYDKYTLAFIGTEVDKNGVEKIIQQVKEIKSVENWCGRFNLEELAVVLKYSKLLITTDTGPMHIAIATKTKTIGLFGVTEPDILVKDAEDIEIVSSYNLCPEKFRFNHNNEPPDWNQECMKKISVDNVFARLEGILH